MLDSEQPESGEYSAPGAPCNDALRGLKNVFSTKKPAITGFYKDKRGEWISVFVPLLDEDGNLIAVMGMDASAAETKRAVAIERLKPIALTALLCLLLVSVLTYIKRVMESEALIAANPPVPFCRNRSLGPSSSASSPPPHGHPAVPTSSRGASGF